jgi:phosphate transport system permease protein
VFGTKITSLNPINASDEALIAMPLQAFFWAGRPQQAFQDLAATGIIVLLVVLLVMNGAAIILRSRSSKRW